MWSAENLPTITLVTHNAYWFQGAPSLWGAERQRAHPAILSALAALYRHLRADILALQEIPASQVLAQLQIELGMEGIYAQGGMRPAYGGGILWRGTTASGRDLSHLPVGPQRIFERFCLEIRGQFGTTALSLVNIHLSSNRYAPDRRGEAIRLAELAALEAAAPGADIVMGDFNAAPDSPVHQYMEDQGYWDPGTTTAARGKRIDYIWLRRAYRAALVEYRLVEEAAFTYGEGPTLLSDHPPLLVRLAI